MDSQPLASSCFFPLLAPLALPLHPIALDSGICVAMSLYDKMVFLKWSRAMALCVFRHSDPIASILSSIRGTLPIGNLT